MASTKYPFNKQVNVITLRQEIEADTTITIMIEKMPATDTDVDIWFKDALPTAQETQLNTIVTNHVYTDPALENPANLVLIQEENVATGGHFQHTTAGVDSGDKDVWTTTIISWPFPVSLLSAEYTAKAIMEGDIVDALISPDTVVGTLSGDYTAGGTTLDVSASVTANIKVGFYVGITDGTNSEPQHCRVTAVDPLAGTIDIETAFANSYLAATPTYIQQTVKFIEKIELSEGRYTVGESKIGASYLPANTDLVIRYMRKDDNTTVRRFIANIEYLY